MTLPSRGFFAAVAAVLLLGGGAIAAFVSLPDLRASLLGIEERSAMPWDDAKKGEDPKTYTVEVTDYTPPVDNDTLLVDDRIEDKRTTFDPELIDRRPIEGWKVNASESVVRLDVPIVKPDQSPEMLVLHPSYAAAARSAKGTVLPSVNLIDGKAKQFDDGLYAALDQAYFAGHGATMKGHLDLVEELRAKVGKGTSAAEYLAAALILAGRPVEASPGAASRADAFRSIEAFAKPIGVYTWTPTLSRCFVTLRFLARPMMRAEADEIARLLASDEALRADYAKAIGFYAKLTNPLVGHSPLDMAGGADLPDGARISLFPPSSSKEGDLFAKLFPVGLPPDADLMRELITAIRSGKVNLAPRKDGGWYDYQVHALETLLLPEVAPESNKLLLTKLYKKRMLEAFKALITKRRETHVRQLDFPAPMSAVEPPRELNSLQPRLRLEPNPTYYLRTARAYAFLEGFLTSAVGEEALRSLKGLREGGERGADLLSELRSMRDLFYGFYLLSAEDIGLKPALLDGESIDREACEKRAADWLAKWKEDADLAVDTRVSVPIFFDRGRNTTRLWMTIGVRLAKLDATYAKAPRIRPEDGSSDWKSAPGYILTTSEYVIPVDEFAEVELQGGRVLTRAELRAMCDRMKTKAKIVEALGGR